MIFDDDLFEIFTFLKRKNLDTFQMVSRHWHNLIVEHSGLLPKTIICEVKLCLLQETQLWSFLSFDECAAPLDNYAHLTSEQIIDEFILIDENLEQAFSFKYVQGSTTNEASSNAWFCRICGQKLFEMNFAGEWFIKLARNDILMHPDFDEHMKNAHTEFYDNLQSGQFNEKLSTLAIPCILYCIEFNESYVFPYHSFFCYTKIKPKSLNQFFVFLTNCYVKWLRIAILSPNGWTHLNELFNSNLIFVADYCLWKEFNFLIHRLNIATLFLNEFKNTNLNIGIPELANFFSIIAKFLHPEHLFTNLPCQIGHQIEALQNSGIFPSQCKYLDIQNAPSSLSTTTNEIECCFELFEEIIFNRNDGYKIFNENDKRWQKLYWMSYGNERGHSVGDLLNFPFGEYALSSLAIYPMEPSWEFLEKCIQHFLALDCTHHLIGRRIRLCKAETTINNCRKREQLNEELYAKMEINLRNKMFVGKKLKFVRKGEYFAKNERTGDKISLIFRWHGNGNGQGEGHGKIDDCEKNISGRKKGIKDEEDCCPFRHSFVLEFPLYSTCCRTY